MIRASISIHGPLEISSAQRDNTGAVSIRTVGEDNFYGELTIFAGDRFDALMAAFPLAKDFTDHSKGEPAIAPAPVEAAVAFGEHDPATGSSTR